MEYVFEWDTGNSTKSLLKHGIGNEEAESVFEDKYRLISPDLKHSVTEDRYICIGKSVFGRILYTSFTERGKYIRIISTRPASIKNRIVYEKGT